MERAQIVRTMLGNGVIDGISNVFDEIGLVLEALDGQVDLLTDEEYWSCREGKHVVRQGSQLAVTVNYLRQLQSLGFNMSVNFKQPARVTAKKGR